MEQHDHNVVFVGCPLDFKGDIIIGYIANRAFIDAAGNGLEADGLIAIPN